MSSSDEFASADEDVSPANQSRKKKGSSSEKAEVTENRFLRASSILIGFGNLNCVLIILV